MGFTVKSTVLFCLEDVVANVGGMLRVVCIYMSMCTFTSVCVSYNLWLFKDMNSMYSDHFFQNITLIFYLIYND